MNKDVVLSQSQYEFMYSDKSYTLFCGGVGSGKCLKEGTLVKTPRGSVKIEDLKVGDIVYGYNSDGSVTETPVLAVVDQGVKDVVDLYQYGEIIATCTEDHRWLTQRNRSGKKTRKVKRIKNFNGQKEGIAKEYVQIPGGNKNVKEAYALGAMIGDGVCTSSGLVISSENENVVQKVALSLGLKSYKRNKKNYSWRIHTGKLGYKNPLYDKWCKNRLAHEKTCNISEIRKWDRESQIEFLSGLIDTDGSVYTSNRLNIQFGMQAKIVVEVVKDLLLDLFQIQTELKLDDRDKYVNGPVWYIRVSKNNECKRILRELKTIVPSKMWKKEYDNLVDFRGKDDIIHFNKSKPYKAQCYDISIGNDTHLYMLANGTVTHNTFTGALWAIGMALQYPNCRGLITANTHSQLRKATLAELFSICDTLGIKYKYLVNQNRLFIGDSEILCYTMENPDNLAGPTVGWWWGDEVAFYKQLAFDKGAARVRDTKGPCHIKFTTTPNGFNWLYEFFVEKPKDYKHVVYSKTLDNLANLPETYVEQLTEQYDAKMAKQELDGQFVNMNSGQVYYNFDRVKHVKPQSYMPNDLILVGLDFNVNPLCGVFVAKRGEKICVVEELYLQDSNTFQAAKEIVQRYPDRYIQVVADETGNRRKTSSNQTDHEILRRAGLDLLPFKNPSVKDRHNNLNRLFEKELIEIDPKCKKLIADMERLTHNNDDDMLGHIADAIGYVVWKLNPLKKPKRKARVSYG